MHQNAAIYLGVSGDGGSRLKQKKEISILGKISYYGLRNCWCEQKKKKHKGITTTPSNLRTVNSFKDQFAHLTN